MIEFSKKALHSENKNAYNLIVKTISIIFEREKVPMES